MRINHYLAQPCFNRYICYPESFGQYFNEPLHRELRETETFTGYNLHLVFEGKGYVQLSNKQVEILPGFGFMYGPGMAQNYCSDTDHPWDVRWIHFYGSGLTSLLEERVTSGVWIFSWKGASRLESLLRKLMHTEGHLMQEAETPVSALLYEIMVELVQNAEDIYGAPASGLRSKILAAADWIRSNCHQVLTLEHVAATAGYSPYYFCRQFHQIMGKTFLEFLLESRIVRAKRLLTSTDWSIHYISMQVGFAQSSYFIRKFREQQGMTPEQFRLLRG